MDCGGRRERCGLAQRNPIERHGQRTLDLFRCAESPHDGAQWNDHDRRSGFDPESGGRDRGERRGGLGQLLRELHEIDGADLHLTLVAQNASEPIDTPTTNLALLEGDHPHARGIYPIPEFYFDYSYDAEGPNLEIPIGQIPLPNLVQGQTLAGDYGVLQSVTIRMVNNDRHNARQIAIYVNPRGGRATGTFLIDRVLVQAHALAPYTNYKLRQYTLAPGSFVRTEIITMPEGGSSYPLRIVVGPDDGSAPPGAPDSPIY